MSLPSKPEILDSSIMRVSIGVHVHAEPHRLRAILASVRAHTSGSFAAVWAFYTGSRECLIVLLAPRRDLAHTWPVELIVLRVRSGCLLSAFHS